MRSTIVRVALFLAIFVYGPFWLGGRGYSLHAPILYGAVVSALIVGNGGFTVPGKDRFSAFLIGSVIAMSVCLPVYIIARMLRD